MVHDDTSIKIVIFLLSINFVFRVLIFVTKYMSYSWRACWIFFISAVKLLKPSESSTSVKKVKISHLVGCASLGLEELLQPQIVMSLTTAEIV